MLFRSPRRVFERAVESAQASGALVSLDVNHRTALWTYEAARAYLEPLLARVGLLFVGIEDARRVFGLAGEAESVAAGLRQLAPRAMIALTLGDQGSLVLTDRPHRPTRLYSLDLVADRVGAGDAFAAGFLHGWLTTQDHGDKLRGFTSSLAAINPGVTLGPIVEAHDDETKRPRGPTWCDVCFRGPAVPT